jgi:Tfp pilus assembly protein PilF
MFELKQEGENKRRKLSVVPIGEGNTVSRLILEKVPLIVLSIIFSVIVFITEHKDSALASLESLSLFARISNALVSYVEYISKMIVPINLAVFYPHPGTWPLWQTLLCLAVLISITYIVIFYIKKHPYLAVGWFWYVVTLVPVIGLVQVGSHAMADRYTYIPLIGLFVIIAWGLFDLTKKERKGKTIFSAISVLIIAIMMVSTSIQVSYWKNSITLFSRAIEVTDGNYMAHFSIGSAFLSKNKIDDAIEHFSAAVKFRNDYALAHYGLGFAQEIKKNYDKALSSYVNALNIDQNYFDVHYRMANLLLKMNRIDEAIFFCRKAIALKPNTAEPHNTLGNIFAQEGKDDEAINEFRIALKLMPEHAGIHNNLAMVYMHQDKVDEAIIHFREAIHLQPEYANAHFNLAKALKIKGLSAESKQHYQEAIRINPEYKDKLW